MTNDLEKPSERPVNRQSYHTMLQNDDILKNQKRKEDLERQ